MLAMEHSHARNHLLKSYSFDSAAHDQYLIDSMKYYPTFDPPFDSAHGLPSFSFSAYETPSLLAQVQTDTSKHDLYRSQSFDGALRPNLVSDPPPSTLSSISGHSVPSASSSTVGSPYSGHALSLPRQDSWVSSTDGLGLEPAIVSHERYIHGFAGIEIDSDLPFSAPTKISDNFVGECAKVSSVPEYPAKSFPSDFSASPLPIHSVPTLTSSPGETIDTILERVNSVSSVPVSVQQQARSHSSSPVATPDLRRPSSVKSNATFKSPKTPASACPRPPRYSSPIPKSRSAQAALTATSRSPPCPSLPAEQVQATCSSTPNPHHPEHFHSHFFAQSSGNFMPPLESSCVFPSSSLTSPASLDLRRSHDPIQGPQANPPSHADPSLIQAPRPALIDNGPAYHEQHIFPTYPPTFPPLSPAGSPAPSTDQPFQPYPNSHPSQSFSPPSQSFSPPAQYPLFPLHSPYLDRRSSFHSRHSHDSPTSGSGDVDDEGKQKGRCPNPDCGRVFKDLKAHMLTHQSERPEKCPIVNCIYNHKGFARKYDKNRHTLTHYKGTMVCGFCPGSGSAAEKSFNRADVFKRHLTAVHGVEQTAPNSRKRSPNGSAKKLSNYCQDATGKCSTCSATFNNAQDFYEHLDDCVLRVVQQEEPSEAINQQHLTEVATDDAVKQTMERHQLGNVTETSIPNEDDLDEDDDNDDDDEDDDDEDDDDNSNDDEPSLFTNPRSGRGTLKPPKSATSTHGTAVLGASRVSKSSSSFRQRPGLTRSAGGVPLPGRGRRKRKHYPPSWGVAADKMNMKKRVLCVYDGERGLWKDDLMMYNEFEVRMRLGPVTADGVTSTREGWVTDLDVETMRRAEAIHGATEEERGPWTKSINGAQALSRESSDEWTVEGQEVDLEELMA